MGNLCDMNNCPGCGVSWVGEEIPQGLYSTGYYATMEDAREAAKSYGWTEENKKCFRNEIAQYCELRDCVVAYKCCDCNVEFPVDDIKIN